VKSDHTFRLYSEGCVAQILSLQPDIAAYPLLPRLSPPRSLRDRGIVARGPGYLPVLLFARLPTTHTKCVIGKVANGRDTSLATLKSGLARLPMAATRAGNLEIGLESYRRRRQAERRPAERTKRLKRGIMLRRYLSPTLCRQILAVACVVLDGGPGARARGISR
jgi:hypothetical protein